MKLFPLGLYELNRCRLHAPLHSDATQQVTLQRRQKLATHGSAGEVPVTPRVPFRGRYPRRLVPPVRVRSLDANLGSRHPRAAPVLNCSAIFFPSTGSNFSITASTLIPYFARRASGLPCSMN